MSAAPETVGHELRRMVESAGGRLEMDVADLARAFGFPRISSRRVPLIAAELEEAGVHVEPALSVEAVRVTLRVEGAAPAPAVRAPAASEAPPREPAPPPAPPPESGRLWAPPA